MENKQVVLNLTPGASMLTLLFVVLKLTGTVAWSWLWVLSPMWIGLAVVTGFGLLIILLTALVALVAAIFGGFK